MAELPIDLDAQVQRLCDQGDEAAETGDYRQAISCFQAAWGVLPEPKNAWEVALRILAAIGDTHFLSGNWLECIDALQRAAKGCDGAIENPFIRLRLGQSLFEIGNLREAANWMAPAYLEEGKKLFSYDDPKYLTFLKAQLKPPPEGWPEGW
jgi:tetratricopeptide (TPR) repeat protein